MDSETTTASPDATTANTEPTSVATPSSESPGSTTQPSTEATSVANPTGAQVANTAPSQPINRSATAQPTTQSANAGASQQQPPDYAALQKRWDDQQSYIGRLQRQDAEHRKYREQWGDLDPQRVKEWYARQQQEAQARQLKPWDPRHPDAPRTDARLAAVRSFASARETIKANPSLDPETKRSLISELAQANGITNEDATLYREHEQYVQDFHSRLARDPHGTLANVVQQEVHAALSEYDRHRTANQAADQWLTDPQRSKLLEKHADDVLWAMNAATPRREVGLTIAQLKAENEALRTRLGGNREVVETAAAQQAALKKRSTVVRDAISAPSNDDPVETGTKQGLKGSALLAHLRAARGNAE